MFSERHVPWHSSHTNEILVHRPVPYRVSSKQLYGIARRPRQRCRNYLASSLSSVATGGALVESALYYTASRRRNVLSTAPSPYLFYLVRRPCQAIFYTLTSQAPKLRTVLQRLRRNYTHVHAVPAIKTCNLQRDSEIADFYFFYRETKL